MTFLRHSSKGELCGSAFLTGIPRRPGWDKAGVSGQSRRVAFKQLVGGSSRNPGHARAPIWRGRLLSNESLRAVQELKRAHARKDDARLSNVMKSKVARLVKFDMLAVLSELQRQDECELAVLVFEVVQKEFWYKPEDGLLTNLVSTLARNKRIKADGVQPSMGLYTDVLSAQVGAGNLQKPFEVYDELIKAGYAPCNPALGILWRALEENGDHELVATLVKEFRDACGHDVDEKQEEEQVDVRCDVDEEEEEQVDVQHKVFS